MGLSVPQGHLGLDPPEELVEVHAEVLQEDGQRRQGRQRATVFDRADECAGERSTDRRLAEARLEATPPKFRADHGREALLGDE
jgi:hypothetical protein